jgi:UDP-N-acetylglucosamine 2-epimerase (non-hydrolysing)
VTLHRPSNVDDAATLARIVDALRNVSQRLPLVFPVHPRTRDKLARIGADLGPRVHLTSPLGYFEMLGLMRDARCVLTDSGGVQEETTALGVPCLTLRPNTERPVTLTVGTNRLLDEGPQQIDGAVADVLAQPRPTQARPELWDGRAAERIVADLERCIATEPSIGVEA